MDSPTFLCPACKVGLAQTPADGVARCPRCGNYYSVKQAQVWKESGAGSDILPVLFRGLIYIFAVIGFLFSIAFVGCLFNFR